MGPLLILRIHTYRPAHCFAYIPQSAAGSLPVYRQNQLVDPTCGQEDMWLEHDSVRTEHALLSKSQACLHDPKRHLLMGGTDLYP